MFAAHGPTRDRNAVFNLHQNSSKERYQAKHVVQGWGGSHMKFLNASLNAALLINTTASA